ncbi:hypothetical protein F5Y18DRAFT_401477 [Xylariaceae sp. FL1019]|nr:hypothetical protein F5Y18DRAFT_401477 [Xylariaceae sp. FL1019]
MTCLAFIPLSITRCTSTLALQSTSRRPLTSRPDTYTIFRDAPSYSISNAITIHNNLYLTDETHTRLRSMGK